MPNSHGTLSATQVSMRVLDFLKEMFPPILRMHIGFSDQRAMLNQAITTRIPGVSAAYDASSGYTPGSTSDTDVSVTANQFRASSIKFTPTEMSKTSRDLIDEHAAAAAHELGKDLMDKFFAIVLDAAYPTYTIEPSANVDDDTMRALRKTLNNRNVPNFGRIALFNSDGYEALTGDQVVTSGESNPQAHKMFELAPISHRQRGFEVIEYPQLPDNSEDLNGIALAPGAIIGATGIPRDANEAGFWDDAPANALVRPQTDPDTGITLLERRTRGSDGSAQLDYAWIFGFAKGDPNRLERLVETDPEG